MLKSQKLFSDQITTIPKTIEAGRKVAQGDLEPGMKLSCNVAKSDETRGGKDPGLQSVTSYCFHFVPKYCANNS